VAFGPALLDKRVVVCVGSGGVGKTTTAAAIALWAARRGRRVLCLTVDPARRLAESLGLQALSRAEQPVDPARLAAAGAPAGSSLTAMMLDTKATFDELVVKNASSPEAASRILSSKLYEHVATRLAGTHEYMAMEKLHAVRDDPRFDLVVLDTPPTANSLDFLDAPDRIVAAVDAPATRWMSEASRGAGRAGIELLGRGTRLVLRAMSRFTGSGFLEDMAGFVSDLNDLFGGFRRRAVAVRESLRKGDVAFVIVTTPEPMAVTEAIFFARRLEEGGIPRDGFVVNRVRPRLPAPASGAPATLAPDLGLPAGSDAPGLARSLLRSYVEERTVAERHAREIARLRARKGDSAWIEIPALDEEVYDLPALGRVAAYLFGES
jgi:anion-transporting  ArsA/GET3 family ATPase